MEPDERPGEAGFGLVEALVAFIILSVGLLAIAGIALSVGAQTRSAAYTTQQALAGQQVMEATVAAGYSDVPTGTKDTTVAVDGHDFTVTRTVTQAGTRVKEVEIVVPGMAGESDETMVTRLYWPRSLPTSAP